jgi:methyltransferase
MLVEARRAARNERAQRARGGIEPAGDVYPLMLVVYPAAFLAMLLEGVWRGLPDGPLLAAGAAVFVAAKALKWWAILALGSCWTFRVIVVPGGALVVRGPYRWLRHPNYVGVLGELGGTALMTGAVTTGPLALAVFSLILVKRIAIETKALSADV